MASGAGGTALQVGQITDRTRSMFRAILAENGIADTDDAILEQEMVMFFKLSEWHLWTDYHQTNCIQHVHIESSWAGKVTLLTAL
jgi:hypothetical protein